MKELNELLNNFLLSIDKCYFEWLLSKLCSFLRINWTRRLVSIWARKNPGSNEWLRERPLQILIAVNRL